MGARKSTVGRGLATLLRRPFVDSDQEIEKPTAVGRRDRNAFYEAARTGRDGLSGLNAETAGHRDRTAADIPGTETVFSNGRALTMSSYGAACCMRLFGLMEFAIPVSTS